MLLHIVIDSLLLRASAVDVSQFRHALMDIWVVSSLQVFKVNVASQAVKGMNHHLIKPP